MGCAVTDDTIATMEDAEALILGLGMHATGGGGTAARGRGYMEALLADGVDIRWTAASDLDGEVLTCSVYGMGSIAPHPPMTDAERAAFGVRGEPHPRPWLRAVDRLEAYLGREIGAIVPFELGPSNTLVALDAAARSGRALVDGDYIGRALPKMSQALPAVMGMDVWPLTICDPWGDAMVLEDCPSAEVAERIGKMVSKVTKAVDMAASCSHAAFPISVARARTVLVEGTLSRALRLGRRVLEARSSGVDPVAAAIDAGEGWELFRGTVDDRTWSDSSEGYMEGTTGIAGSGRFAGGARGSIWFQNEHHVLWVDERVAAASPDILAVVDEDTSEPISNTELEVGRQVAVLGFRCAEAFRTGRPLAATEPRHYGIDVDYVPIEALV
jgi:DUF917 family protein